MLDGRACSYGSVCDITIHPGSECGVKAAKRDLAHFFQLFKLVHILTVIMQLQWPEFLITRARVNFDASSWKMLEYALGPFSLPRPHVYL